VSKLPLIPTLVGVVAGAIAVAGYHKASTLQDEVHRPPAPVADKPGDEVLERELHQLQARVAALELRARVGPREADAPSAAPSPPFADPSAAADPDRPEDVGPVPKDPKRQEERKKRISEYIGSYWKEWGAKHGLSTSQSEGLAQAQAEASLRRLDNQAKIADKTISQVQGKADNAAAAQEVRKKAQALLSPAQFGQFEDEKGAEWGSSFRRVHEMVAKAKAAAPPP
jgi:hypothetical protein